MPSQTTEERVGRIGDRNYFKRPDRLTRIKHGLSLAALALAGLLLVWLAAVLLWGQWASVMSPGPVTAVHAAWDSRCDACHKPFHGIHTQHGCATCHAGPAHFEDQSADTNRCTSCHIDHRGRDASLIRVPDQDCIGCHRDLTGAKLDWQKKITDFVSDHPLKSRSVRRFNPNVDRALKFSHAVHLSAGMELNPKDSRRFRLRDIQDEAAHKRYLKLQGGKPEDPVQLDCRACHRLDAADLGLLEGAPAGLPGAAVLPPRAAGANPLPITYEIQCKACHPLGNLDGTESPPAIPHRVQPAELREFLERAFASRVLSNPLTLPKPAVRPDQGLDRPDDPGVQKAKAMVERLAAVAFDRVLAHAPNACTKCHLFSEPKPPATQPAIRQVRAHAVWYKHARFTHVAHRAVDCRECHPGAYPGAADAKKGLIELEPSFVPEVDKCMACHGPSREVNGRPVGGARADCVECHRYHNGAAPLQGIGAAARDPERHGDPKRWLNVEEFLRGKPPHGGSGTALPSP